MNKFYYRHIVFVEKACCIIQYYICSISVKVEIENILLKAFLERKTNKYKTCVLAVACREENTLYEHIPLRHFTVVLFTPHGLAHIQFDALKEQNRNRQRYILQYPGQKIVILSYVL